MKILFLAPCPFFQERGTPIAIRELLIVLAGAGHTIDLLCYHEGEAVEIPGVTLHRITPFLPVRGVPPGPSLKKIVCDLSMARQAVKMAKTGGYDLVHAVEESAAMARWVRHRFGIPYVFDMDSSMPGQVADKFPWARPILAPMEEGERRLIAGSAGVVAVCQALADTAQRVTQKDGCDRPVTLLEDPNLADFTEVDRTALKAEMGTERRLVTYVGNLESYQGIGLLLKGFATATSQVSDADLLVVGGHPDHIALYKAEAEALGIADRVHFPGPMPLARLGFLLGSSDVLISSRAKGENTPMKIYSYMASGTPIVATAIRSHTQVLHDDNAVLAAPEPEALADGIVRALTDPNVATLGAAAKEEADERFNRAAFSRNLLSFYEVVAKKIATAAG